MKVYIVQLDWSTTDCEDTDLYVYDTYDKAYNKFKELIAEEKSINSWLGDIEWDDEGQPIGQYEFWCNYDNSGESEVYWHITDQHDWYRHTFIDLLIKEVM